MKKLIAVIAALPLLGLLYLATGLGSINEIKQWRSPDDNFALSVVVRRAYLDVFGQHEQTMIVVGLNGAVPGYGHPKDYSFINGFPDQAAYIARCTVTWTPEGVRFEEPAGHVLFIPKSSYQGGR